MNEEFYRRQIRSMFIYIFIFFTLYSSIFIILFYIQGPLDQFTHSMEPNLRQLGLPTSLQKGIILSSGETPHWKRTVGHGFLFSIVACI